MQLLPSAAQVVPLVHVPQSSCCPQLLTAVPQTSPSDAHVPQVTQVVPLHVWPVGHVPQEVVLPHALVAVPQV
jgi:hypothetical protein